MILWSINNPLGVAFIDVENKRKSEIRAIRVRYSTRQSKGL